MIFKYYYCQKYPWVRCTWTITIEELCSEIAPSIKEKWSEVKITQVCSTLCDFMDCSPPGTSVHGDSPGKNTAVDCHFLLQGIFPTQGLNPGLLHCRRILYQMSHKESPRILEWVAYPFSRGSSQPKNQTGSPSLQTDSWPTELWGKPS